MTKRKTITTCLMAALSVWAVPSSAQLLKGTLEAEGVKSLQVAVTYSGDVASMQYHELPVADNGSFAFDTEMPVLTCDVAIYVANGILGAHLEKGKTTVVRIVCDQKTGQIAGHFEGDNADKSRFYSAYSQAFDLMKYFSPDPSEAKTPAEYKAILAKEYAAVKALLPTVKDKKQRARYAKLTEGMHKWTLARIIMDQAYDEKKNTKDYPEFTELLKDIDPNDPDNLYTNLHVLWMTGKQKYQFDPNNLEPSFNEAIDLVEREITDPVVRKALVGNIGYNYFILGGSSSELKNIWPRFQAFAKDYPNLIAQYEAQVVAAGKTEQGSEIPYDPLLTRPDGTTCRLSDLFGTLLYIDIWATWCGPCCEEIPFMEKLVEKFKGNSKVEFISISVDANKQNRLDKLAADKPQWKQFLCKNFTNLYGITGIPRFLLIDKTGHIITANAPRPSDPEVAESIQNCLK